MAESPDQLMAQAGQMHAMGRLAEAEAFYRAAMKAAPERLDASAGLGVLLSQTGLHEEALRLLPHDLVFRVGMPLLLVARGSSLLAMDRAEEAIICLQRAVQIDPAAHEAFNTLGCALLSKKLYLESVTALRRAIQLDPNYAEAYFNLGLTLFAAGMFQESADVYCKAGQIRAYPQAHLNRGFALRRLGDMDAAIASFHEALALQPNFDQAMHNLGATLADVGKVQEGVAWLRRAIATHPRNHHAHSALLYVLNFDPEATVKTMADEQRRWQDMHVRGAGIVPLAPAIGGHSIRRIGYVSPDFRAHPISRFLLPLLENHDRRRFEVHLFSSVQAPDAYTEQFQKLADRWHDVGHLSDGQLADKIRDQKIDILIDLTMHMEDHRLLAFARQPAPVQVSWLAYPGVTGVETIRYHVTDKHLEPTSVGDGGGSLRLGDSWFCYQPDRDAPPVNPLPALVSSRLTFGSLNTFRKMNPRVILLWARTLTAVAAAQAKAVHLVLSCPEGSQRQELLSVFEAHGIPPGHIEFFAHMPYAQYLKSYQQMDIALDPFPHNGATTTLDSLHMGVPVLALKGTTPAGRLGESILTTAGLTDWLAATPEDFILKAVHFSGRLEQLGALRGNLRDRVARSPLCDAGRFAGCFEEALLGACKATGDTVK